ncbi:MAG: putative adenylyl cyclase CyaB [Acidobacteria bacterium]|nr:putative adenylyl cyclase CyaB [Acidobacteriota bacterium]
MPVETEIKVRLHNPEEFRTRLRTLGVKMLTSRHFEDNFVLDSPEGNLRSRACLLRVRRTSERESVTFKGPPIPSQLFKSREELETTVESAETMLEVFERLGLTVWFRYQKFREEYLVVSGPGQEGAIRLAVDMTPIGDFAELEGSEDAIRAVAGKLGFEESQYLRESYYALYAAFCRARDQEPGMMVFPESPNC